MSKSPAERMKRMIRKKKRRSMRFNANGREVNKIHYFKYTHTSRLCVWVCLRWVHGFENEALPTSFCCHFSFSSINPSFSYWANGPCLTIAHWRRVTLCHVRFLLILFSNLKALQCQKTNRCRTQGHKYIHTHTAEHKHTHSDVNFVQSIYHLICSPPGKWNVRITEPMVGRRKASR